MSFTFTINGHTYTSDPTDTGVPLAYHFDGYNYLTAFGNLVGDLAAVAAQALGYANAASSSATTATTQAGISTTQAGISAAQAGTATTQAGISTTQAGNSSASATLSSQWATTTGSLVASTDYSAKEWAVGTFTRGASGKGSAKDWANYTGGPVDGADYSAKYWAQQAGALATGQLIYMGAWDASSGSFPGSPVKGAFWKVDVAGTVSGTLYSINDDIVYNGTTWDHIDNQQPAPVDPWTSMRGKTHFFAGA